MMLAGLLLTGGGVYLIVTSRSRRQGVLMIVAGLVMFANVLIATVPLD